MSTVERICASFLLTSLLQLKELEQNAGLVLVMPTSEVEVAGGEITFLSLGLRLQLSLVYSPSVLANLLEKGRYIILDVRPSINYL